MFIDANVLLEVILPNRKKTDKAIKFLEGIDESNISMLTVHLLLHFGAREKINPNLLHDLVRSHRIHDLTEGDYQWARKNCIDDDFEDALQVAVAVRTKAKQFVTLDKNLAKNYARFVKIRLL